MPPDEPRLGVKDLPTQDLKSAIPGIASEIARFEPGPAATLRRGPFQGAGAAAFWKLLAKYNPVGARRNERGWADVIQSIAILTPKGRDPEKKSAHDFSLPLGRALHGAEFSEERLARLLATGPETRGEVAIRACRRLASGEFNRFNLVTLGYFVLSGSEGTNHQIAREYYRAYAAAERASQDKETSADA